MLEPPEWSELPRELLSEISQKLPTLSDYLRFRAVCPTWRSSAKPSGAPRASPCLLLEGDHTGDTRPVHSISTGTTYTLRIPELRGKRVCGCRSGWLVLAEKASPVLTLPNPLTGSQIPLPPSAFTGCDVDVAFLSSAPTSPGCAVLVSLSDSSNIAFCRSDDTDGWTRWTTIQTQLPVTVSGSYELAYHNGKLFAVDDKGLTSISEPGGKETLLAPPETSLIMEHLYLVADESTNELLLVGSYIHTDRPYGEKAYHIFKLEEGDEGRGPRWVNVRSMGRRSLLLCNCQSLSVAAGGRGCRESCLYIPETLMKRGAWHQDIIVYNWRTCDVERLQCKMECCVCFASSLPAWFVPSL